MKTETIQLIRQCTPPVLWSLAKKARCVLSGGSSASQKSKYGAEQPPEYYDKTFRAAGHWQHHYTQSHYYPLWSVMADRILRAGVSSILDIGCGPGQVGCLLRDKKIVRYLGIDFSPERVKQAKSVCPEFDFAVEDIFASDMLETGDYDCVVALEFLEHVEADLEVFKRIKPGSVILASVPNFPDPAHVRFFCSTDEVHERYHASVSSIRIDEHLSSAGTNKYFLIEARK